MDSMIEQLTTCWAMDEYLLITMVTGVLTLPMMIISQIIHLSRVLHNQAERLTHLQELIEEFEYDSSKEEDFYGNRRRKICISPDVDCFPET